jgi:putative ABC transport system permease protein
MIFDKDNWQEIFIALKSNKLRTALTAFGVFWGLFMLIVLIGSGRGLYNGATKAFKNIATNSVFIWARQSTKPYKGFNRGRRFHFNNSDIDALKENLTDLEYLAPRIQLGGHRATSTVSRGLKNGSFTTYGDFPEIINIRSVNIMNGRFINDNDIKDKRKVAVIGKRVKKLLFDDDEKYMGEYIKINGVDFRVVGLFGSYATGDDAERDEETLIVPFSSFQQAFNYNNIVGYFALTSVKGVPVSIVKDRALKILASRHNIAPDDTMAFGHWNLEKVYIKINNLFLGINGLNWFVGILSLLAGIIGVSNIMLIIVKERTREIGIKRAIGATPLDITGQIVLETVFLTTVSGYAGLFLGVSLLEIVSAVIEKYGKIEMFKSPEVDLQISLIAFAILVVSGVLAGLIPAKRAIDIQPVNAISVN